ncbi:hypothetical protein ACFSLT_30440 [Novosphingobium resinovorum]
MTGALHRSELVAIQQVDCGVASGPVQKSEDHFDFPHVARSWVHEIG